MQQARCPRCGGFVSLQEPLIPSFPFCTPFCQDLDLHDWLTEEHRIPGKAATDPDEAEDYEKADQIVPNASEENDDENQSLF